MNPDLSPAAGETIGQRLKRLRLERGLSQRELAAPGVSYAYISRIEAGTRQPSVKALRRLAAKLGVTADYLETGSDLDPASARELKLADLELQVRLREGGDAEAPLRELVAEADGAGDRATALRARVALATLVQERGSFDEAVKLFEAALEDQPFDPVSHVDLYGQLVRAYAGAGKLRTAVVLLERCVEAVGDGRDVALEARYAVLLSYALTDLGDTAAAESVVQRALERVEDTGDPYMRIRLYWSMARLAHSEGRAGVALANARKAIALLQATEDTMHLARAHLLAAGIMLSREDPDGAQHHLDNAETLFGLSAEAVDTLEIKIRRSKIARLRGQAGEAVALAQEALAIIPEDAALDRGTAYGALADALSLSGDVDGADGAYRQAVDLLEAGNRCRDAANVCRAWALTLREQGRAQEALDVLDRATDLATRATPEHAER